MIKVFTALALVLVVSGETLFFRPHKIEVKSIACPDGKADCPTGNTCCQLESGEYGCCGVPNAVCCSDKKHCCPEGTRCEETTGKCKKGKNVVMNWLEKEVAVMSPNVVCPDGSTKCKTGQTCCKLPGGGYGCCPLPKAVCCTDGKHCCPDGYTCEAGKGKCIKGDVIMDWFEKQPALTSSSVVCPDGKTECKTGQTCCKTSGESYGCCPIPNAVCCTDGKHCCPDGYTCEAGKGKCIKGDNVIMDWFETQPALMSSSVVCPDGKTECKTGQTCCKTSGESYGCCPIPNAVCCTDGKHCCPDGYTCEAGKGKCIKGDNVIMDWFEKQPVLMSSSVLCPDGKSECKTGQTCCKTSGESYGCCPIPNAVCCTDGKHCCPDGYTCEAGKGKCIKGDNVIMDWFEKQPVLMSSNVKCPDGKSECKTGQTCCKTSGGSYCCCPIPNAVCCKDGTHCCPHGTKCEPEEGKCVRGKNVIMDWFEKQPALMSSNVKCPDGKSECKTGQTCCKTSGGSYGCCPIPNAVCCKDRTHCCPNGYTCEAGEGKCIKGDNVVMDWFEKQPALISSNVICPDGQSQCKTGQTCCKTSTGEYGCCPLPKAVCCKDKIHCCPNGYTCEVGEGKCIKGDNVVMDWFEKQPALISSNVICPDGQSQCKTGQTCCKTSTGGYGCCPLPKAVCCSDMKHCCAEGYKCAVKSGKCVQKNVVIDWFEKHAAMVKPFNTKSAVISSKSAVMLSDVTCPDKSTCKTNQTCCEVSTGKYGCCPVPNAVCCKDHKHCCPEGTTCEVIFGKCKRKDNTVMDWFEKQTSLTPAHLTNVPCPDGSSCKTNQTCCEVSSGKYGCCPSPKAVCCSDHKHCCPNGTTCETILHRCKRGDGTFIDWLEKQPSLSKAHLTKIPSSVMCPDGASECQDGQTCCQLASGHYGCCPVEDAVCCSDMKHCCAEGYKCAAKSGKCVQKNVVIDWFEKHAAMVKPFNTKSAVISSKSAVMSSDVTCPDKSTCKTNQTCCEVSTGKYGCCPVPNAVCCKDHKHCCPEGTTCEVIFGKCKRKDNTVMDWFEKQTSLTPAHLTNVPCPDGSSCKTNQTCCEVSSGKYGCCPSPKAVCCSDHKHCCPNGTTCETILHRCKRGDNTFIDWLEKQPSLSKAHPTKIPSSVMCPDGASECQDGQTCCQLASGHYGCCPVEDAVCCSDHVHCCPQGTTCDLKEQKCIGRGVNLGLITMDMFKIQDGKSLISKVSTSTICPDGRSECSEKHTCCKNEKGDYGCCPLEKAVCCNDLQHCCPYGTKCNTTTHNCVRGDFIMDWYEKESALMVSNIMCPDNSSECRTGYTCCKLASGNYGCCPAPLAVCCPDMKHCCPKGTRCDGTTGKCVHANGILTDWLEKETALKSRSSLRSSPKTVISSGTVTCPDQSTSCPDKNTCCKKGDGNFGCCAYNHAVCCKNGRICCPKGYICDDQPEICRMPAAKDAWKDRANQFIQKILTRKIKP